MARPKKENSPIRKLQKGESYSEKTGLYYCYYYDEEHKRKKLTSTDLDDLREKKLEIENMKIRQMKISSKSKTLDDCYGEWLSLKRGISENTKANYVWLYEHYALGKKIGKTSIQDLTKVDLMEAYNSLHDGSRRLTVQTIDGLHNVISQVCKYAIEKRYILSDPSRGAMANLKKGVEKKQAHKAITKEEQKRFLSFIKGHPIYDHWFPVFQVLLGTGLRAGECCGLTWDDVDLEAGIITIDHTLVYHGDKDPENDKRQKMRMYIGKPKTKSSKRTVVMLDSVKEAFKEQRKYLEETGLHSKVAIEGKDTPKPFYSDFVFLNKDGGCQHQGTLNKALRKIIRDANLEAMNDDSLVILPDFSCHNFRSTYITRSAESGVDINVTMAQVGHSDSKITMQIYTTVNPDWKRRELQNLQGMLE